jgi:hypothetical protein
MAVSFHEFSALTRAPGDVPIAFSPTPAPLSFATLLGNMWRSIYPHGDPPHYQVFQFSAGGRILEYVTHVHLSASVPVQVKENQWVMQESTSLEERQH